MKFDWRIFNEMQFNELTRIFSVLGGQMIGAFIILVKEQIKKTINYKQNQIEFL